MTDHPSLLTIAGTDPSSGAGIQVDLQMFARQGFHGTSVITAILWQDTHRVHGWHIPPVEVFTSQLRIILEDIPPRAIKLGVLPSAALIHALADTLEASSLPTPPIIVHDPVLASGDGTYSLVEPGAIDAMRTRLFPHVTCLTPNLLEAAALLDTPLEAIAHQPLIDIAARLSERTDIPMILLKAGHAQHDDMHFIQDAIATPDAPPRLLTALPRQPLHAHGVRGTGCQLASALTASLARGLPFADAAEAARADLATLLATRTFSPGKGRAVIGYFSPSIDEIPPDRNG